MSDIYTRADGLIDIVKFLDDEIDISRISKNISFKDIIRKDKKFTRNEHHEYLAPIDNILEYIENSKLIRQYEKINKNIINTLTKRLLYIKIEIIKNEKSGSKTNDELERFFNFKNFVS